jgi:hypothetical protein
VKELLANGADPNKQDQLQHTPFMMAAWFGKIDAAREIFEKVGTDCVYSVCAWCMRVSLCFFCGCFSVRLGTFVFFSCFVEAAPTQTQTKKQTNTHTHTNAQMNPREIQLPNVWGLTPLDWARQSNRSEVVSFIERRYIKLGLPVERYASVYICLSLSLSIDVVLCHNVTHTEKPSFSSLQYNKQTRRQRGVSVLSPSFPLAFALGSRFPLHWQPGRCRWWWWWWWWWWWYQQWRSVSRWSAPASSCCA